MVSGDSQGDTGSDRNSVISQVARKALLFGEFSAKYVGGDTFDDPVMHTYFLFYVYGAVKALGQHESLDAKLTDEDDVNAMGRALLTFENTSREDVMGTLKLLYRAQDPAALRIRDEGRKAAAEWDWGANEAATRSTNASSR